jgi:hypothetical protein
MKIFYPILVFSMLLGAPAQAHSFLAEGGAYDLFVEGTTVILQDVRLLLPIVALGLLISLWKADAGSVAELRSGAAVTVDTPTS